MTKEVAVVGDHEQVIPRRDHIMPARQVHDHRIELQDRSPSRILDGVCLPGCAPLIPNHDRFPSHQPNG
jgi:hypothetical protein